MDDDGLQFLHLRAVVLMPLTTQKCIFCCTYMHVYIYKTSGMPMYMLLMITTMAWHSAVLVVYYVLAAPSLSA